MTKRRKRTKFKGFTLIELMVVVTIIAVLAALIVPALQKAQAKSMSMKCLSIARAIGSSIRTYASNNNGWTNTDTSFYVKDFGYRLSHETGYEPGDAAGAWADDSTTPSYQRAQTFSDFICPVAEDADTNIHAIRSSYTVTTAFGGKNIMNMTGEANRTLMVKETGEKRHPAGGELLERTYVYADLSATIGYNGPMLPGLIMRAYNQANSSGLQGTAESTLPDAPFQTEHSGDFSYNNNWARMLAGNDITNWDNPGITNWNWQGNWLRYLGTVCLRFDGLIRFPAPGIWEFYARSHYGHTQRGIGIGSPGDTSDPTSFTWSNRTGDGWHSDWGSGNTPFRQCRISVPDTGQYYPFQYIMAGRNSWSGCAGWFDAYWRYSSDGGTTWDPTYGGATGQVVPGSALFIVP